MNQLYLCTPDKEQYLSLLNSAALPQLQLTDKIEEANIIFGQPNICAPLISKAKKLTWFQSTFAGCDALLALAKQDYLLSNVRGVFGPLMSEYVFGYLISLTRHFSYYQERQQQQIWSEHLPYQSLKNRKMTLLGTGSIGQHIAKTAKHFGMQTLGVNLSGKSSEYFDQVVSIENLNQALNEAEIVVSVLPSTAKTIGLLNKQRLACCNNAIFFNVGRGSVLIEQDLLWAIENKHIRHAVLDVFDSEPLTSTHPFWHHSAITITPHNSAKSFPDLVFGIFAENYRLFIDQKSINYLVDFKKGY